MPTFVSFLLWRWFAGIALGFSSIALAQAQAISYANPAVALEIAKIEVLSNVDSGLSLQQILDGQAGPFQAQATQQLKDLTYERSIWAKIHLRASANAQPESMTILELKKPFLDSAVLYSPVLTAQGWSWQVQRAGVRYPSDQTTLPGQLPRFVLPAAASLQERPEGLRMVILHIPHRVRALIDLRLLSGTQALAETRRDSLGMGFALGAITLVGLLMCLLAWLYKSQLYLWYGAYTLAAGLFAAANAGLGQNLLWPIEGDWPATAFLVTVLVSMACQLQFSRLIFLTSGRNRWASQLSKVLGAACVLLSLVFIAMRSSHWIELYFASIALIALTLLHVLVIVILGWRQRAAFAAVWLLIYLPLFLALIYSFLNAAAMVKTHSFMFNMPIYAYAFEVIAMGIAIMWFTRDRQAQIERQKALDSTDPLTGFSNADSFQQALMQAWQDAKHTGSEVSVVYVSLLGVPPTERTLRRVVRILRTVSQEGDTVARLDDGTMALMLPGIDLGEDLSARLSRIVALGLIPDSTDRTHPTLRFRISATSSRHYTASLSGLGSDLRRFMADSERWVGKPIRFLTMRAAFGHRAVLDGDTVAEFWDQALEAERVDPK